MAYAFGPGKIVQDGLVFYVDAANKDSYASGSLNTFSLINPSITGSLKNDTSFVSNNAGVWDFDGTDDIINLGSSDTFSLCSGSAGTNGSDAPSSIGLWFNTEATQWQDVISKIQGGVYEWRIAIIPSSTQIRFQIFNSGSGVGTRRNYYGSTSISTNTWNNCVVTYDGTATNSSTKMYLNGESISTSGDMNGTYLGMDNTDADCVIGATGDLADDFEGQISTVKIYKDKVISSTEVAQNYNALKGRFI